MCQCLLQQVLWQVCSGAVAWHCWQLAQELQGLQQGSRWLWRQQSYLSLCMSACQGGSGRRYRRVTQQSHDSTSCTAAAWRSQQHSMRMAWCCCAQPLCDWAFNASGLP